jgi:exopolysaccharide biosynthesis polyprenyl glycosylphosphotransferase
VIIVDLELLSSRQTVSAVPVTAGTPPLSERLLTRRILILGSGPMAAKVVEEIEALEGSRDVVAGLVDHEEPQVPWARNTKWLGPPSRLVEIVERVRPGRIVVAFADRRDRLPLQLLLESRVRGVIVEDAVEFYERLTGKMAIESLNPSTLILSKGFRNHGAAEIVARIVSVIGAAVGLAVSAPLLLAIAVAIRLDSRGPVLFIQSRAGRNGRPFGLLKFRTMRPTEGLHSEWARDNTHRITRVGRWLRRFRLDELPQLVNVLTGEMNLIGPRPHPTCNHEIFMDQIAYYPLRSTVRPGVTGWAQVRYGYANDLEEETEKMRYDLYYIKNRSIWLDAWILLRTVLIVILGQGATEVKRRTTRHTDMTWSSVRTGTDGATYAPCLVRSNTGRPSSGRH